MEEIKQERKGTHVVPGSAPSLPCHQKLLKQLVTITFGHGEDKVCRIISGQGWITTEPVKGVTTSLPCNRFSANRRESKSRMDATT